ncbi:MAG: arylsulfatase A-like enzyme, partial [Planctomycetota bacterium]
MYRLLISLSCIALLTSAQDSQPKRPNILVLLSDDHAVNATGVYGSHLAGLNPTPRIDQLAQEGMLFRNAFCTNSLCGPSRAVILTGKHSHRNGFLKNGDRFDGSQATFPSLLQAAGYNTGLVGKWHLGTEPQGFDHWEILPGQGSYYNPVLESANGKRTVQGYCTDIVTDLAIEWLDEQSDSDEPFMLLAWHKAPHRNWMPAPEELALYSGVTIPEPASLFDSFEHNASPARHHEMGIAEHMDPVYDLFIPPGEDFDPTAVVAPDPSGFRNLERMTPTQRAAWDKVYQNTRLALEGLEGEALVRTKYQLYMRNYLATVRGLDRNVGRLLDHLESSGLAENTIVIYSSDQGFFLGEHGWFDKRWMYEESLRAPLVVRWPGHTKPGSETDALVQNLDFAPTLLEVAGASVPEDIQGSSLVPLLEGNTPADWRDGIYYHYHGFPAIHNVARHRGIRTERFKLMQFYDFGEWELYDLKTDPNEIHNLFQEPAQAGVVADLSMRMASLATRFGEDIVLEPLTPIERRKHWPVPVSFQIPDLSRVTKVGVRRDTPGAQSKAWADAWPEFSSDGIGEIPAFLSEYFMVTEQDWLNNSHVSNLDLIGILTLEDGSELPYGLRPGGLAWLEVPGHGTLR